jgi:hypothetical protein
VSRTEVVGFSTSRLLARTPQNKEAEVTACASVPFSSSLEPVDRLKQRFSRKILARIVFRGNSRILSGNGRLGEAVGSAALGRPFIFAVLSVPRSKRSPYLQDGLHPDHVSS